MKTIEFNVGKNNKIVTGYINTEGNGKTVVLIPGGGYDHVSLGEGDPVAFPLLENGFNVFKMQYSVNEEILSSHPLKELSEAVVYIKKHAKELNVDKERIFLMGFSAGGHLAASLATLWNNEFLSEFNNENKPRAAVLCYPVITADDKYSHKSSIEKITQGLNEKDKALFSLENQVSRDTIPCFLWHTRDDESVPVENSLLFFKKLNEYNIDTEMHIFPHGRHGLSIVGEEDFELYPQTKIWFDLALAFINNVIS